MLGRLEFLGPPPVKNLSPFWVSIEAKYEESHFTEWGSEALRGDTTCPENRIDIRIHACVSPKLSYLLCLSCTLGAQMDKPRFYSLWRVRCSGQKKKIKCSELCPLFAG